MIIDFTLEKGINMDTLKKLISTAVFAILLGSSSLAVAKSGWEIYEFTDSWSEYVNCLGEYVDEDFTFTVKFREFETPSGTYHYVESWSWIGTWVGETTGRVWLEEGFSPGAFIVAKGEVGQYTGHAKIIPVEGDGPKLLYNRIFKYTINANGDMTVFLESPAPGIEARCLGPKEQ
jgi:hypothetical protein